MESINTDLISIKPAGERIEVDGKKVLPDKLTATSLKTIIGLVYSSLYQNPRFDPDGYNTSGKTLDYLKLEEQIDRLADSNSGLVSLAQLCQENGHEDYLVFLGADPTSYPVCVCLSRAREEKPKDKTGQTGFLQRITGFLSNPMPPIRYAEHGYILEVLGWDSALIQEIAAVFEAAELPVSYTS